MARKTKKHMLSWYCWEGERGHRQCRGQDDGGVTVAKVRYAQPGEAEGGLGAMMRFLAGARGVPGDKMPRPSAAGYYHQATSEARGVWHRPRGPFSSAKAAMDDCDALMRRTRKQWDK